MSKLLALKSTLYALYLRMPSWPLRKLHCDVNVSFRLPRGLGSLNKFGQIQELINDNYSDNKLYSNFHIEYKAIAFIANKK